MPVRRITAAGMCSPCGSAMSLASARVVVVPARAHPISRRCPCGAAAVAWQSTTSTSSCESDSETADITLRSDETSDDSATSEAPRPSVAYSPYLRLAFNQAFCTASPFGNTARISAVADRHDPVVAKMTGNADADRVTLSTSRQQFRRLAHTRWLPSGDARGSGTRERGIWRSILNRDLAEAHCNI